VQQVKTAANEKAQQISNAQFKSETSPGRAESPKALQKSKSKNRSKFKIRFVKVAQ
jgi:hypothetical protein